MCILHNLLIKKTTAITISRDIIFIKQSTAMIQIRIIIALKYQEIRNRSLLRIANSILRAYFTGSPFISRSDINEVIDLLILRNVENG